MDQSENVAPVVRIFHSSPKKPEKEREEWYYAPSGKRSRYVYCDECSFRATYQPALAKHIKAKHPPLKANTRRAANVPASLDLEKWYVPPGGGVPISYKFCGDCDAKFLKGSQLKNHVTQYHPSSINGRCKLNFLV